MRLKYIFLGILIGTIAFAGCDKITNPIIPQQQNSTLPPTPPTYKDSSTSYELYKVLLEDCGGQQCSNCPGADSVADVLIAPASPYYGKIVMMEENIGGYATPTSNDPPYPSYAFSTDYRSVAGNTWYGSGSIFFPPGWPAGYINRVGYNGHVVLDISQNNWQDTIQYLFNNNPTISPVQINIHDSCWVPQRIIGVELQLTFNKALSGTYSLETLIIEDNIVSWQEDYYLTAGYDSTFVHHNVLRGAFGNNAGGLPFGITIPGSVTISGSGAWTSYQTYDFNNGENGKSATWNMANCYIVAFIYNQATYQIIQAEEIKVE